MGYFRLFVSLTALNISVVSASRTRHEHTANAVPHVHVTQTCVEVYALAVDIEDTRGLAVLLQSVDGC